MPKYLFSLEIASYIKQPPAVLRNPHLYIVSLEATAAVQGQLAGKQDSEQRGRESAVCCLPTSTSLESQQPKPE